MTFSDFIANKYECKVTHAYGRVLDPCSCSSYYAKYKENWIRNTCNGDKLWNHNVNICDEPKTVLDEHLCDPISPWERCQELSDYVRSNIITKCMRQGFYTFLFDVSHADESANEMGPTLVSRETQLANVHLMFASMFAGCVITLIVVAMLMEFCSFTRTSMKTEAKTEKLSDKPIAVAGIEVHGTDGGSGSALYDDIKEQEGMRSKKVKPGNPSWSGRTTHEPSESGSQALTSPQHRHKKKAPGKQGKLDTHMVPKTKSKPLKKEKGGNIERPPRPPQLEHKESIGYIHPVYH